MGLYTHTNTHTHSLSLSLSLSLSHTHTHTHTGRSLSAGKHYICKSKAIIGHSTISTTVEVKAPKAGGGVLVQAGQTNDIVTHGAGDIGLGAGDASPGEHFQSQSPL
jgi:hypothetical protein